MCSLPFCFVLFFGLSFYFLPFAGLSIKKNDVENNKEIH